MTRILVAFLASCALLPPAPEPDAARPDRICLTERPPEKRTFYVAGVDDGCPAEFEGCLGPLDAAAVLAELRELRRYARQAWLKCGPLDAVTE